MSKLESLDFYILNSMADDGESIVQIEPHVKEFHGPNARDQLFESLRNLHARGYLRSMDENGDSVDRFPDDPTKAWFLMTNAGRAAFEENILYYDDD